jgi:hypothetical protein
VVANTTRPTFDGDVLDMYLFYPKTRTVAVTATDNVKNGATTPLTFQLHATAESLLNNIARAKAEGKIEPPPGLYVSLRSELTAAKAKHDEGRHDVEAEIIKAFANDLEAQRGKGVDNRTATRFIAYALDLIEIGG